MRNSGSEKPLRHDSPCAHVSEEPGLCSELVSGKFIIPNKGLNIFPHLSPGLISRCFTVAANWHAVHLRFLRLILPAWNVLPSSIPVQQTPPQLSFLNPFMCNIWLTFEYVLKPFLYSSFHLLVTFCKINSFLGCK